MSKNDIEMLKASLISYITYLNGFDADEILLHRAMAIVKTQAAMEKAAMELEKQYSDFEKELNSFNNQLCKKYSPPAVLLAVVIDAKNKQRENATSTKN